MRALSKMLTVLVLTFFAMAHAQETADREHPRVSELQDKMTDYARGYLQTRLQGIPFMVTVRIEAIRRAKGSDYKPQNEKLPYFDLSEEEIQDEWDDPSASLYVLQSRLRKATVMISLPKSLKDDEVNEIRDSLTSLLRLIPGRDEVRIEQRNWTLGANFWYYSVLAGVIAALLLLGLAFISRSYARRLASAIHEIKPKERAEGENNRPAAEITPGHSGHHSNNKGGSGDLKFRDPLKTREFIAARVSMLAANPNFPNLQAMIEMDKLAERAPKDLGALLMEFPLAKQKEIFALSYKPVWLGAFTDPGELSSESIELAERLCRIQYVEADRDWENLIIQIWRQGNDRVKMLSSLPKDEAFAILKAMPVSIAVPVGRQAFPGAWGVLLDATYAPPHFKSARIKDLHSQLLEKKPANSFAALERYKQETDLLSYLLVSTVAEEKEVYGALPKDSFLWQVRPPYFQVLEAEEDKIKILFEMVSLDDWALALFNVSRDRRRVIEKLFNSKQLFLFNSKMRAIDQAATDKAILGEARERIARLFQSLAGYEATTTSIEVTDDEGSHENKAA